MFCLFSIILIVLLQKYACMELSKLDNDITWQIYKDKFNVVVTEEEEVRRSEIFYNNLNYINEFNNHNQDLRLGVNKFAHLERHEMPGKHKISVKKRKQRLLHIDSQLPLRPGIDWRKFGVVSPVEDQDFCSSSYAFSAVGAIESSFALRTGDLVVLSKQQIVDCTNNQGNHGCNGGYMHNVFHYAHKNGMLREGQYNYTGQDGKCRITPHNRTRDYHLLGHYELEQFNENALVRALSFTGPVSIAIDANHDEFRFYKSGILRIKNCSSTVVDHAVLAVGYQLGGTPYLLVKNSWSTAWGIKGYFKIALFEHNMCGLASSAYYPTPHIN